MKENVSNPFFTLLYFLVFFMFSFIHVLTLFFQGATERCSIEDLVPLVDTAMSPEYASIKKRMDSFSGWRFTNKADPRKMAEAGFFYTGRLYTF